MWNKRDLLVLCELMNRIQHIWWRTVRPTVRDCANRRTKRTCWCRAEWRANWCSKRRTCRTRRPVTPVSSAWSTSRAPKWPSAPASKPVASWSATGRPTRTRPASASTRPRCRWCGTATTTSVPCPSRCTNAIYWARTAITPTAPSASPEPRSTAAPGAAPSAPTAKLVLWRPPPSAPDHASMSYVFPFLFFFLFYLIIKFF